MRTTTFANRTLALLPASILLAAGAAHGAEIKLMTSGAFTAAYLELKPQFEEATGNRVVTLATGMGSGADYIPNRLQRGEVVDVVIVDDAALDGLIKEGRILANSKVPLAQSIIGMTVKAGAPKPDISSVEALKRTLLAAKSIAYSSSVSGDYLSRELFLKLGVADQIMGKSKRIERERVAAAVARGDAEIGFQQVSEILPVPGADYAGPLPAEVQRVSVFSAGVAVAAKEPEAARALIRFLASPSAEPVIIRSGMEPIPFR